MVVFDPILSININSHMPTSFAQLLINRRLTAILIFGFASGLPLALTGATLQAWFTQAHIDLKTIGALSLIGIPYTLKFLWAPLMDHPVFSAFGRRKSWILMTQALLVASLFWLSQLDPSTQAKSIGMVALLVAFFSASQDISINAYTTDVLRPEERGLGAAYTVLTYRFALLVSGGLALILADQVGFRLTYLFMTGLMALLMFSTYFAPSIKDSMLPSGSLYQMMKEGFSDLLQRDKIIIIFLFIMFYKFGDALALSLMTNFLLQGLGFSLTEIGVAYKLVSMVAMIVGGLVGGMILTRSSLYVALLYFGLAQAISNLMFAVLAYVGKSTGLMIISVFIENFCSGLSTAALLAFIMSICHRQYTASQFALFSAVASLGRVFLGPVAAMIVKELGWVQFYVWSFVLCVPGLLLLISLKNEVLTNAEATMQ